MTEHQLLPRNARRREIAEETNARLRELHALGKDDADVAEEFGCSVMAVRLRRLKLGLPSITPVGRPKGGRLPSRLARVRGDVAKRRQCLHCGRPFDSHGPGNRICGLCKDTETFRGAEWLP